MADTDMVLVERGSDFIAEVGQLQPGCLCCVIAYVVSSVEGTVMTPVSLLKTT